MDRVEITRRALNVCTMQVCAVDDATDAEILEVCNYGNPAGTEHGWMMVLRESNTGEDIGLGHELNKRPLPCQKYPGRTHFLVLC